MGLLKIFNVLETKSLVSGPQSIDPFLLPDWIQGEAPSINFYLLTQNFQGGPFNPWSKILPQTYSLRAGIYDLTGLQLAFQSVFAADNGENCQGGILTYNSANITASLAGGTSLQAKFECEITDNAGAIIKTYQQAVTFRSQILPAGAAQVPQNEVAATQSWVRATFAPRVREAGSFDIWTTPNGNSYIVTLGDDKQWNFVPISNPP